MLKEKRVGFIRIAVFAASVLSVNLLAAETLVIGKFDKGEDGFRLNTGQEFPGAKGSMEIVESGDDKTKCLKFSGDFSKGGQYVSVGKSISSSKALLRSLVKYKTDMVKKLTIRMIDATGQVHQGPVVLTPDGNWNTLVIPSFKDKKALCSWGGAKDKKWHPPCTSLSLLIEKGGMKNAGKKGDILIETITAELDLRKIIPEFKASQQKLGNIYLEGEDVEIAIETKFKALQYYIKDFNSKIIQRGTIDTKENMVKLKPEIKGTGHYSIFVNGISDDGLDSKIRQIDFAIVPKISTEGTRKNHFGSCTHFSQGWNTEIIPLVKKSGIIDVRDGLSWGVVEKVKGQYSFNKYQKYMDCLKENGITPLIVLSFANKLYDNGLTPHSETGVKAYSNYANAVLDHFGKQIKAVDVWNEYNGSWCKGPAKKDRGKFYAQMLKQVYTDIKAKHPDVTVLGGAAVLLPLPYFRRIFENDGLNYMDKIVIHPYRGTPEGVDRDILKLKELEKEFDSAKDLPIAATEYGCFDMKKTKAQVSYMVRMTALMLSVGVKDMDWYLFMDNANFVGMGLIHKKTDSRGPYSPAPSYVSMAVMNKLLADVQFEKKLVFEKYSPVKALKFKKNDADFYVLWSTQQTKISIKPEEDVTLIDLMGKEKLLKADNGSVVFNLDSMPFYLSGKVAEIKEIPGDFVVIADSVNDYSSRQGDKNWYYGYYPKPGDSKSFAEMKQETNMWGARWGGIAQYMNVSNGGMHAGLKGKTPLWAVRRWKSDISGEVMIKGSFWRGPKGDGSSAVILIDGIKVFDKNIGGKNYPKDEKFEIAIDVKPGTVIDFCATPGPQNILLYDGVGFKGQITVKRK